MEVDLIFRHRGRPNSPSIEEGLLFKHINNSAQGADGRWMVHGIHRLFIDLCIGKSPRIPVHLYHSHSPFVQMGE